MSDRSFQFFLQFHQGVPRQGPGVPEATAAAFGRIRSQLPPAPRILDLGCGSGDPTLTLAALTEGSLLAVDSYEPFIEELRQRLAERGLEGRVAPNVGDMNALELAPASFDLVWCEGAIFIAGFERGLGIVHKLLGAQGITVISETAWLRPLEEVPRDVLEFWRESYPPMTDVEGNLAMAKKAGFEVLDHFTLPPEGWAAYVDPVEQKMNEVLARNPGDPDAEEAAQMERREFAMFRKNRGRFGYEFFLLKKR